MIRVHVEDEPIRASVRSAVVVPGSTSQLINDSHFVSDADYVHTDHNYTSAEKTKLAGIEDGAEVNVTSITAETFGAKADGTNALLQEIAFGSGSVSFTDFRDLQRLTRLGLAGKVLSVGDQLSCERATAVSASVSNLEGNSGITAASVNLYYFLQSMGASHAGDYAFYWDGTAWRYAGKPVNLSSYGMMVTGTPAVGDRIVVTETTDTLLWDVLGIDCDTPANGQFTHSVTLGLHDCYSVLQFDAREALFYVGSSSGLAAGTYHFTVTRHPFFSADTGKTFQFTLSERAAMGSQLVLDAAYNAGLAGSKIKVYSGATATTASQEATISEGGGGTSLGDVGISANGNTNSLSCALQGNNNYAQSAIRQYINGGTFMIWNSKNKWDRPPAWRSGLTQAGFLSGVDASFLSAIGEVTKKTALVGGGSNESTEKFFLLSQSEVYGGTTETGDEGTAYPYYSGSSSLSAAGTGSDSHRIKYRSGSVQSWWLRSPSSTNATYERYVYNAGQITNNEVINARGIAPACCIV